MKKRRLPTVERLLLLLTLSVGLCVLGNTYAAWTTGLNIRTNLRTGMFNIIFSDSEEGDYYAWVTDEEGGLIEELEVDMSISKDGKQVDLTFNSGLPVELLVQGYYIKVGYPLKQAENNTISEVKPVEPVLEESGEEVRMKAKSGILMVDGTLWEFGGILEPFMIPLKFHTYKGVEKQDGVLGGYLYLKLAEESLRDLEDMPEVLELDPDVLEKSVKDQMNYSGMLESTESGVIIAYSCELPLYLDQNGAHGINNSDEFGE